MPAQVLMSAQMVVWLWYGNYRPPTPIDLSSPQLTSSPTLTDDPFATDVPLNPLQVQPSPAFVDFVTRVLQVTMVSHSVMLVALLYIHKLRLRQHVYGQPGSEQRPFVASLMLGNKYLDE
jgi:hypothetical protein